MKKLKNLKARLLSISLAFAMVLSLAMGIAPMKVKAANVGDVVYQYNNAYDCQRSPAFPTKGSSVRLHSFKEPYGGGEISGNWEIIYQGKYDSTIHENKVRILISNLASYYGLDTNQYNTVDVYTLKQNGNYVCDGVIVGAFRDGLLFCGTSLGGSGAGYYLTNAILSGNNEINDNVSGDLASPAAPPCSHSMTEFAANAKTCTTAGNNVYYKCENCGKYFKDAEGNTETTVEAETIPAGHSWVEDSYQKDERNHWKICSGCSEVKDSTAHGYTDEADTTCDTCGYTREIEQPLNPGEYRMTIDSSQFTTENAQLQVRRVNNAGSIIDTFNIANGDKVVSPAGGKIVVFCDETREFTVTVTDTNATVSERSYSGPYGAAYTIDAVDGNGTIVIASITQGDGDNGGSNGGSNPPAPAPTPTPDSGSNGGSSSGSDSSSTPSTSTPSTSTPSTSAPITVPVSNGGNDNVLNINASVSGETAKVNELTAEEIDKVAKNETKDSIEINLSETGKTVKEASLPVSSLNEIARIMDDPNNKLDNITIKFSTATVEVSEHTLKAVLSKTTGNDLRLVVDDIQKDTLNDTQKNAVKDQNVHQCIDAYFISNGVRIGDFQGGTATIRIPFNVPAGLNGNGFSVWYVGDDGTIEKHDTRYVNGELVFTVSHFSDYVVVYDGAVKDNVPKTGEAADYTTLVWTSILTIGVLGLVLNRQKRRQ